MPSYKYGIVIDSGSSGSRIQIYRWEDPVLLRDSSTDEVLHAPPKITQEKGWSHKISPGISTFADKKGKVWTDHYQGLLAFAEQIVPAEQIPETPIYVLSTAGMRLLPKKKREAILKETCRLIQKNSKFLIGDCAEHVQVIDGATEGIYGWLALNSLMGKYENYQGAGPHESIGFMDMGGASTQIAFVPAEDEIIKHDEDLSTVIIRNINGESQTWRVFVETWLGFGANQARARYLNNLCNLAATSNPLLSRKTIKDPCMPAGATMTGYEYNGKKYTIKGTGNYQSCLRQIYPLLMKHLPCKDEPCLFNGIHAPKMNFEQDKFVGVSEYWYTANDIFHSGGEYNFHSFNEKVKTYCESLWDQVLQHSKAGEYSNLPDKFLLDACFKASWVINILHEGFELPRLDLEILTDKESPEMIEVDHTNVPFKSADSVNGEELSWTLGKILIVASSQITPADGVLNVGITPSAISQRVNDSDDDSDDESIAAGGFFSFYSFLVFLMLGLFIYRFGKGSLARYFNAVSKASPAGLPNTMRSALTRMRNGVPPLFRPYISRVVNYMELQQQVNLSMDLEEGNAVATPQQSTPGDLSTLRTRSTINLDDLDEDHKPVEFINKPFAFPKKNALYNHRAESGDSLPRISSSGSMARGKTN